MGGDDPRRLPCTRRIDQRREDYYWVAYRHKLHYLPRYADIRPPFGRQIFDPSWPGLTAGNEKESSGADAGSDGSVPWRSAHDNSISRDESVLLNIVT